MNWDELNSIWMQQASGSPGARNLAALELAFRRRQRKHARARLWRDLREAVAGLFVAAVFARVAWQIGSTAWPIAFAVVLMLGLAGFFVFERWRVARRQLPADAPLLAHLEGEITEQRRQRRLLMSVAWWYLGPCMVAAAIFGATTLHLSPIPVGAKLLAAGLMIAALALCSWAVMALNQRAVRHGIDPRLQELEALRAALLSPD